MGYGRGAACARVSGTALWRVPGMVQTHWARLVRVVQGLATLAVGTVSGGGRWASSQTRLARLVLPLACCPHWVDMGALGLFTIDDIGELTVGLELS